jgi:23S rRNA (guanosine2251-2'-O)-methyltransferase
MKTIRSKTGVRELHKGVKKALPPMEIAFLLQDWDDPYNVGGMFRVADAVGAVEMFATGKTPPESHPQVAVTSLGHHRRIPYQHFARNEDAAIFVKEQGYTLIAIEIADDAVSYVEFDYPEKVCFVLGNEERGIYGTVMKHADAAVYIPMLGKGRSMNVHVAAAVVSFHARLGKG